MKQGINSPIPGNIVEQIRFRGGQLQITNRTFAANVHCGESALYTWVTRMSEAGIIRRSDESDVNGRFTFSLMKGFEEGENWRTALLLSMGLPTTQFSPNKITDEITKLIRELKAGFEEERLLLKRELLEREQRINTLETEHASTIESNRALNEENTRLQQDHDELVRRINGYETDLASTNQTIHNLEDRISALKHTITTITEENSVMKDLIDEADRAAAKSLRTAVQTI